MKVVLSYACELKDIPEKVAELLGNLEDNDLRSVTAELSDARSHSYEKNITETLEAIDRARIQLNNIDNSLIDYATILAGYSKTIADIQLGNDPVPSQEGTQEVVPHNILDIREEEDADPEAEETND
tara:strand:- start:524 stop:904 length:381 start_codon:yes stop_codon:yes gene_type:complete